MESWQLSFSLLEIIRSEVFVFNVLSRGGPNNLVILTSQVICLHTIIVSDFNIIHVYIWSQNLSLFVLSFNLGVLEGF